MGTLLPSSFSNFKLVLSPDFLPDEFVKKYKQLLLRTPDIISEPIDLLNHAITGFTLGEFTGETVTQENTGFSTKKSFRNSGNLDINKENNREITIEFKHTESYLTWFMLYDLLNWYWDYNKQDELKKPVYLPPVILEILTVNGFLQLGIEFRNTIFKTLDGLTLSYTTQTPEFTNFTATFEYQYMYMYNSISM